MLAHLFSRSLSQCVLYSKFLDPILIDSYFSVNPKNLYFGTPLLFDFEESVPDIDVLCTRANQFFHDMVKSSIDTFPTTPITLIQRIEILRVLIIQTIESYYQVRLLISVLNGERKAGPEQPARGTIQMEKAFLYYLKILRNVSLPLFSNCKYNNWYDSIKHFGFADLFCDVYEGLVQRLTGMNYMSQEKVLFFLNIPSYFRKCEVIFYTYRNNSFP